MLQKLRSKSQGFTIIEVLIVLAIAGLIILIVFLAVPSLQRNSRNTQRKNDITGILGAMSEYSSNNGGKVATTSAIYTPNVKLGFFDTAQVLTTCAQAVSAAQGSTACAAAAYTAPTDNQVAVRIGAKCDPAGVTTTGANMTTIVGASSRNKAVVYKIEGSGASSWSCQES